MKISKTLKYNYVELFSGCGGMSLGLESAGFTRLLANEISPMAAETFAYNLVNGARHAEGAIDPRKVGSWNKHFCFLTDSPCKPASTMDEKSYRDWRGHQVPGPQPHGKVKDILTQGASPNLLVGSATCLAKFLEGMQNHGDFPLWRGFDNVDILAGGPPCQSFSLAGKREKSHPRNSLFLSFVRIARALQPKAILFENVVGITKSFRDEESGESHPWFNVCCAFREAGYIPIPSLVNAAYFGVPQARPRFIMVALREDVATRLKRSSGKDSPLAAAIALGQGNYGKGTEWKEDFDHRLIFRHDSDANRKNWPAPLFPAPSNADIKRVSVSEAIGDLIGVAPEERFDQGHFAKKLDRLLKRPPGIPKPDGIKNHKKRSHGDKTRARFRLLSVLAAKGFRAKSMAEVIKKSDRSISLLTDKVLYLPDENGGFSNLGEAKESDIGKLLEALASAKHAQRVLNPDEPAPAQLSIPDDFIHWEEDRVLTIREMARIQSFPDWFEFRSKETTGGSARAYEVPQYTQIGNAVPPLLARSFGLAIRRTLGLQG
jgi:DNA (cytosine-5)-methyltransferase 1